MTRRWPWLRLTAAAFVVAAVAATVAAPLLSMLRVVWTEGGASAVAVLTSPGFLQAVRTSVLLAAVVTLVAVPVGTLCAVVLRRTAIPGRRLLQGAVLLPVVVPDFVLANSWQRAYGTAGLTDSVLGVSWSGVQGPVGVATVLAVNAVPIGYLVAAASLAAHADPDAERAALASGASGVTVLRTVTLPLLRPALAAGAVLVFVLSLASFAVPEVLGAPSGLSTVTTRIYSDLARSSSPHAFVEAIVLALALVAVALAVVAPADAVLAPRLRVRREGSGARLQLPRRPGDRWAAAALALFVLLGVVVPLLALVATAVTRAVGLPPTPQNWTIANFSAVLTEPNALALGRSLVLAAVSASVLVVLGGCVAALERTRGGRAAGTLVTLTLVLPGSTLAVGLLITYGRWIGDTPTIIALAYVGKLWAFAHRPVSGAVDRLAPEQAHASRASGAGPLTTWRTAVLPPLRTALLTAWLVCFLTALHEVTMFQPSLRPRQRDTGRRGPQQPGARADRPHRRPLGAAHGSGPAARDRLLAAGPSTRSRGPPAGVGGGAGPWLSRSCVCGACPPATARGRSSATSTWLWPRGRWSRSSGRPDPASPPCCTRWPASTRRAGARSG